MLPTPEGPTALSARTTPGEPAAASILETHSMTDPTDAQPLNEEQATDVVWRAIERAGGTRSIYRNPRMAFALNAKRDIDIDGHEVEIRYGEISTPAIATVEGWVFEIHEADIDLLVRPRGR
jgi:hypothetical protein